MLLRVVIEAMRQKKETRERAEEGTLVRFSDIILSGRGHSLPRPRRRVGNAGNGPTN